ncbi:single-stranded DNA-binding protein [Campylobacter curvus]|uniref:single-stranded DNA-binding protein n=1 Tax=Campylobacter curvus TaxID=200 RepID=UPI0014705F50|nr:single-stranded DNA-binding protein [Campylobacter curvus]
MFNKVILVGNLSKDVSLSYLNNGVAVGKTSIAVNRKFSVNGEKREEVYFIDIAFFGKQAETANQYLGKGSKLLIEGRLKLEQWTDNNGQNRSKHSISVENMEMLGSENNQHPSGNRPKVNNYSNGNAPKKDALQDAKDYASKLQNERVMQTPSDISASLEEMESEYARMTQDDEMPF